MTTNGRIEDTKPGETDYSRWADYCDLQAQAMRLWAKAYEVSALAAEVEPDLTRRAEAPTEERKHAATYRTTAEKWQAMADKARAEAPPQAPRSHVTTVLDPDGREVEVEPQH